MTERTKARGALAVLAAILGEIAVQVHGQTGQIVLGIALLLGLWAGLLRPIRSRRRTTVSRRQPQRQPARSRRPMRTYSPECLDRSHGECDGKGCDCTCGHPGRSRTRGPAQVGKHPLTPNPADEEPPF